ncbi:diphosphomevalonate decarboxylase [Streptococcus pluranimalium]|uniref:diphosphomevalonate decarboxylase n=1 Tax=Streptococcus pluranimalium TaxID=82348 RepID=UPI0024151D05|nr:diphosphomevalonate decarboxylase [Streptococcus pluranimalium]MDY3042458.1 diphosphomevalonate decarboxylase [Streptococcus pluranimalium]WFM80522.1 diphosphomevalonate decarboxylase [Streptococcus pluranimalium]HEM6115856.1 diphosphomevalonate decarboxylase [Streptococcus suis]
MDRKPVKVKSYANIAIIKYWGKADAEKMIPSTSSISLTLDNMFTETQLSPLPEAKSDEFYIGDVKQEADELNKMSQVLNLFRTDPSDFVKIETWNNMPTAAGLSSSSSGLSALVKAANDYFQAGKNQSELAQIAKFASGSSSRSFFGPLSAWDKDTGEIYRVETNLKLGMIMLVLNDQRKPVSSREGMKRASETSAYFPEWLKQSEQDYKDMLGYLKDNAFEKVGELTESNALRMHETNHQAQPSFSYLTDKTQEAMDFVKRLRESGEKCYFTMDAGPNVKVLCLEEDMERLAAIFKENYHVIISRTKAL